MSSNHREFLRYIRPPYFDAFQFLDIQTDKSFTLNSQAFFKVIFCLEGGMSYRLSTKELAIGAGDIVVLPRFTQYYAEFRSSRDYRRIVLWFADELLDTIDSNGAIKNLFHQIDTQHGAVFRFDRAEQATIFGYASKLVSELEYGKPFGESMAHGLLTVLFVSFYRAVSSQEAPSTVESENEKLISAVVDYVNNHLQGDLALDTLADIFFLDKYHLGRLFAKQIGVTLHSFITQRRLKMARQKLYQGSNPTHVYRQCGFSDYSSFYRAFRRAYGISPKEFSDLSRQYLGPPDALSAESFENAVEFPIMEYPDFYAKHSG